MILISATATTHIRDTFLASYPGLLPMQAIRARHAARWSWKDENISYKNADEYKIWSKRHFITINFQRSVRVTRDYWGLITFAVIYWTNAEFIAEPFAIFGFRRGARIRTNAYDVSRLLREFIKIYFHNKYRDSRFVSNFIRRGGAVEHPNRRRFASDASAMILERLRQRCIFVHGDNFAATALESPLLMATPTTITWKWLIKKVSRLRQKWSDGRRPRAKNYSCNLQMKNPFVHAVHVHITPLCSVHFNLIKVAPPNAPNATVNFDVKTKRIKKMKIVEK